MVHSLIGRIETLQGQEFVLTDRNETGWALFGPYESYDPGHYTVSFAVDVPEGASPPSADETLCCTVDVAANNGETILARQPILASRLKSGEVRINLNFEISQPSVLEFRVFASGASPLQVACNRKVLPSNGSSATTSLNTKGWLSQIVGRRVSRANGSNPVTQSTSSRYAPILASENDNHDTFFAGNFPKFLDLHSKGAVVTPTLDGTIVKFRGVSLKVKSPEDWQIIDEIFVQNEYNFNVNVPVCVVDIGMNIGLSSLFFAHMEMVKAVYSFEPFEAPFLRALENFSLNPEIGAKINPHKFGLGGTTETVSVLYDETNTLSGSVRGRQSGKSCSIDIKNAAEIFREVLEIAAANNWDVVVKMDCEGSEFPIFEVLDAGGLLPKIRVLLMEWHKWWSADLTQHDLIARLLRNGFDVFDRTNPFDPFAGNLYAVRSGPHA